MGYESGCKTDRDGIRRGINQEYIRNSHAMRGLIVVLPLVCTRLLKMKIEVE